MFGERSLSARHDHQDLVMTPHMHKCQGSGRPQSVSNRGKYQFQMELLVLRCSSREFSFQRRDPKMQVVVGLPTLCGLLALAHLNSAVPSLMVDILHQFDGLDGGDV